jgi:hypothetical protein
MFINANILLILFFIIPMSMLVTLLLARAQDTLVTGIFLSASIFDAEAGPFYAGCTALDVLPWALDEYSLLYSWQAAIVYPSSYVIISTVLVLILMYAVVFVYAYFRARV